MEAIYSDKDKFAEIMKCSTVPYKDFMFDDLKLKKRCWAALTKEWDVVKRYSKKTYDGHPKDVKLD